MKRWALFPLFLVFLMRYLKSQNLAHKLPLQKVMQQFMLIHMDSLKTNKESAFSALASALTGKSPYSSLRKEDSANITIRMKITNPNELTYGMLGFFAGKVGETSVNISGLTEMDRRQRKAMCGGMGTSGTCAKFYFDDRDSQSEKIDFDEKENAKCV